MQPGHWPRSRRGICRDLAEVCACATRCMPASFVSSGSAPVHTGEPCEQRLPSPPPPPAPASGGSGAPRGNMAPPPYGARTCFHTAAGVKRRCSHHPMRPPPRRAHPRAALPARHGREHLCNRLLAALARNRRRADRQHAGSARGTSRWAADTNGATDRPAASEHTAAPSASRAGGGGAAAAAGRHARQRRGGGGGGGGGASAPVLQRVTLRRCWVWFTSLGALAAGAIRELCSLAARRQAPCCRRAPPGRPRPCRCRRRARPAARLGEGGRGRRRCRAPPWRPTPAWEIVGRWREIWGDCLWLLLGCRRLQGRSWGIVGDCRRLWLLSLAASARMAAPARGAAPLSPASRASSSC